MYLTNFSNDDNKQSLFKSEYKRDYFKKNEEENLQEKILKCLDLKVNFKEISQ